MEFNICLLAIILTLAKTEDAILNLNHECTKIGKSDVLICGRLRRGSYVLHGKNAQYVRFNRVDNNVRLDLQNVKELNQINVNIGFCPEIVGRKAVIEKNMNGACDINFYRPDSTETITSTLTVTKTVTKTDDSTLTQIDTSMKSTVQQTSRLHTTLFQTTLNTEKIPATSVISPAPTTQTEQSPQTTTTECSIYDSDENVGWKQLKDNLKILMTALIVCTIITTLLMVLFCVRGSNRGRRCMLECLNRCFGWCLCHRYKNSNEMELAYPAVGDLRNDHDDLNSNDETEF